MHLIETRVELRRYAAAHPELYVQEYLPIDRDLRVVSAYWRRCAGDFRHNVARGAEVSFSGVPDEPLALCVQARSPG